MKRLLLILIVTMPLLLHAQQGDTAKVVNFGVRACANASQMVLRGLPIDIVASPKVGVEGGAFLDFNIGKRFFIRFNTVWSHQRSRLTMDGTPCPLASFSIEVPVYASWRFGNSRTGWGFVGVGPYTEFVVWGRVVSADGSFNPFHHVIDVDATTGEETLAMTDSHSGFGVLMGYELPFGLFVDATAQMALTDMLAFDHGGNMWVRPLKLTLGLGWRF